MEAVEVALAVEVAPAVEVVPAETPRPFVLVQQFPPGLEL